MESTIHGFSKPNVLAFSSLGSPPALAWDIGGFWINAGLAGLHVAEDLHSINSAALVRIDPVFTCRETKLYFPHFIKRGATAPTRALLKHDCKANLPLFQSGWQSFRSLQVRAGLFFVPSGLRMSSIWLFRDFSVASTSASCWWSLSAAWSALMYLKGSGPFSGLDRPAKADMSMPGPGGPGRPGGPGFPGGP